MALLVWGGIGDCLGARDGRPMVGLMLGAVLGPFGWLLTAVLGPSEAVRRARVEENAFAIASAQSEREASATKLRPCPWCAELVQPAAIVCRYCGRDIVSDL